MHKVGHEVGNPLTSIISLATVIERFSPPDGSSNADAKRTLAYARSIISESWRISGTMEKLVLLFSQRNGSPAPCDVTRSIQSALSKLRTRRGVDSSLVHLRIHGNEPPAAFIDQDQFVSLIAELLDNAFTVLEFEAEPRTDLAADDGVLELDNEPASIEVEAWSAGDSTTVCIHSWANAPCPYNLSQLFEPLVTAYSEQKRLGLGLTSAYAIVQRAQGLIQLEERELNGRYRFSAIVELPHGPQTCAVETSKAQASTEDSSAPPAQSLDALFSKYEPLPQSVKIFIVEDEASVASAIERMLELTLARRTILACRAMSGQEVISEIKANAAFDLILCDLNLGRMSGRHVYETLLNERPKEAVKFIFLTGEKARPETQLYLQTSGRIFLHKPFTLEELVQAVMMVLAPART